MKVKVNKEKNGTCIIRLAMLDSILVIFVRILDIRQHRFTQTWTYTFPQTQRGT